MTLEGLTAVPSQFDPRTTMDRLASAVEKSGIAIAARIDHAAAAEKVGLSLQPTELLIFGNPKVGTTLMQSSQTAGIDLPLKALVWQDTDSKPGSPTTIRSGSLRVMARAPGRKPYRP
jgi:uncharacterized protein (DUF302 family)